MSPRIENVEYRNTLQNPVVRIDSEAIGRAGQIVATRGSSIVVRDEKSKVPRIRCQTEAPLAK